LVQPQQGGMLIGTICGVFVIPVLHLWSNSREIQAGKSEEENPLTEEIDNNEVHK
jgi:HAE1 family hydrophobic/amphiphilic exporter-1